jgi:hypothetical protein
MILVLFKLISTTFNYWSQNTVSGSGHYLWRRVAPKKNIFLGKHFADPTIKTSKKLLANLKYHLKNKYPLLAKNITKVMPFTCHTLSFTTSVT